MTNIAEHLYNNYSEYLDKRINISEIPDRILDYELFKGVAKVVNHKGLPFKVKDIACHCGCGEFYLSSKLLDAMVNFFHRLSQRFYYQDIHAKITNVHRCFENNKRCGGHPNSEHKTSEAWDIKLKGIYPQDRWDVVRIEAHSVAPNIGFKKYYLNKTYILHLGIRDYGKKTRW